VPWPKGKSLRVTAVTAAAQLGGTERVLLDFAARAFEHDIALRVVTPRHGPLVDILNEIGVPTEVVPGPTRMMRGSQRLGSLISIPGALVGLAQWARCLARHPYVADTDLLYAVAFKAYVGTARQRVPVVWHLHEYPPAITGPFWTSLGHRVPVALVANSRGVAAAWRPKYRGPPIGVVENGVDLDRFRPRERTGWIHQRLGLDRAKRLVGMPAVLAQWKGQLEVVHGFARMAARYPDVDLVFVGGTIYDTVAERDFEARLRGAIARANARLGRRVHLLPFQTKVELVYPEMDAVVHYSLRPEAFGRVIVEAMACAVPVLAAGEGGPVELVGEGGWLVAPREPAALAERLAAVLDLKRETLADIGAAGRRRAEDHYSARGFARGVASVLRTAAK